jgi:hypothetical protein
MAGVADASPRWGEKKRPSVSTGAAIIFGDE